MFELYKEIAMEQIDFEIQEGLIGGKGNFVWPEGTTFEQARDARDEFARYLAAKPIVDRFIEAYNNQEGVSDIVTELAPGSQTATVDNVMEALGLDSFEAVKEKCIEYSMLVLEGTPLKELAEWGLNPLASREDVERYLADYSLKEIIDMFESM